MIAQQEGRVATLPDRDSPPFSRFYSLAEIRALMAEPLTRRFDVDPFRGWVCLSILVMHFYFSTILEELTDLTGTRFAWCLAHLRLGVESFFILAGFFLAHSFRDNERQYLSAKNFIRRRFLRLLIPYWVVLVLAFLNHWLPNVFLGRENPLPTLPEFLAMMGCVQNLVDVEDLNFTHWSMTILLQSYFLWAFTFWVVRKWFLRHRYPNFHERTEAVLRLGIFIVSLCAIGVLIAGGPTLGKLLPNIPYIGIGVLLYGVALQNRGWTYLLVLSAANLGYGILLVTVATDRGADIATEESRRFTAVVSTLILFWIGRGGRFPNVAFTRFLAYIGKRSYSVYLTHMTVGYRIINLTNHFESTIWTSVGLFVAAVVASLIAAILFYHFVEEPLSRRVREIEYRR